ncbi:MAG: zinc-dependent metalloprotease [Cyclobacteriaceae bacterium]|nr:zinc-dependent metalloprotease [Cyclobacteriaceae bacterium]
MDIIHHLNSSFNQYGIYFELSGTRDWYSNQYADANADPDVLEIQLTGLFEDPQALQHSDAIDIYLLPADLPIKGGGFVPSNNKKVMFVGGTRTVNHCSGGSTSYEIAASQVVSHEMGHCLGLPHTFEASVGTDIDYVRNRECIDPITCQFVSNCTACNVSTNPTLNMNNFMAYTVPNCMSIFSYEQVSMMKANLDGTMASVVNRIQGAPNDFTGEIVGPSVVSTGTLVWFNLSDQAEENETYVWETPMGFFSRGKEGSSHIQTWVGAAAESGNVRVWKTNLCGESPKKSTYVRVIPNDCISCQTVNIFPIPASDELYISHLSPKSGDQESFEKPRRYLIVDVNGKPVLEFNSLLKNLILDLSGINSGVYLLMVKDGSIPTNRRKLIIVP